MNLMNLAVFFCLVLGVLTYEYEDMYEMKRTLEKLTKQNEEFQKQMSTITSGLTEMCRAVNLASCDCADKQSESRQIFTSSDEELKFISLVSHGEINDSVNLTLKFEATDEYSMEWLQALFPGNANVRTPGAVKTTRLANGRTAFTSDVQIYELQNTRRLFARIFSNKNVGTLDINVTAITEKGEEFFSEIQYKITRFPRQIVLPKELPDEYNVTFHVGRNILELVERRHPGSLGMSPNIYLTIINTTSTPSTISEINTHDGIFVSQNDNGIGDIEVVLTIQREHLQNGGLLSIAIPQPGGRYTAVLQYGVVIELLRDELQPYVPPGSIALYESPKELYVQFSVVSVTCFAMGNPRPDVSIYRERNGRVQELLSDPLITDNFFHFRSLTLRDTGKKGKSLRGTYVCEATNGNETVQIKTMLTQYRGIKFDERKSMVTVNTTKKVVVSCKASGNPAPKLEIRLGSDYGPNLLEAEGNFTHKSTTKGGVSKVAMTFSPPDRRFDVLYCAALQTESNLYVSEIKEIRLFPEDNDWSYDRWSFYDSFRKPYSGL